MMLGNKKPSILKRKSPGISSPSSSTDEYYKKYIVDAQSHFKQQRYPHVMKIFCNQTQLEPIQNDLPKTHLKQLSHFCIYAPQSDEEQREIALLWSLANALFSNNLKDWLTKLLQPEFETQLLPNNSISKDRWEYIFTYICHNQIQLACESLEQMDESELATLVKNHDNKDTSTTIANLIQNLKDQGKWESLPRSQQKIMYALAGDKLDDIVTENLLWKSKLTMYLLFAQDSRNQSGPSYREALEKYASHHNDQNEQCLWYQLLQWWYNNNSNDLIHHLPLDFVWLLSIYKSDSFNNSEYYTLKWIEELQTMEEYDYAIYASLFLQQKRESKVRELLRMCEPINEQLLHQFHIPADWILIAKALHAHDDFDFENEYKYLLQGNLEKHAKMALMLSLLPKLFNSDDNVESSLNFIEQYHNQDDPEIKALKDIYTFLVSKQGDAKTLLVKLDILELSFEHSASFNRLCEQLTSAIKAFI